MDKSSLRFPIGEYQPEFPIPNCQLEEWINDIQSLPEQIQSAVEHLKQEQLGWRYRPSGWCIAQVVHHCADSHMNGLVRTKLALTESHPTIQPYSEALWADLIDGRSGALRSSLSILEGVHARWTNVLKSLNDTEWNRTLFHPEYQKEYTLKEYIGNYSWHGRHHLAHIRQALQYQGEFGSVDLKNENTGF